MLVPCSKNILTYDFSHYLQRFRSKSIKNRFLYFLLSYFYFILWFFCFAFFLSLWFSSLWNCTQIFCFPKIQIKRWNLMIPEVAIHRFSINSLKIYKSPQFQFRKIPKKSYVMMKFSFSKAVGQQAVIVLTKTPSLFAMECYNFAGIIIFQNSYE